MSSIFLLPITVEAYDKQGECCDGFSVILQSAVQQSDRFPLYPYVEIPDNNVRFDSY